jgi:hypothetical protein
VPGLNGANFGNREMPFSRLNEESLVVWAERFGNDEANRLLSIPPGRKPWAVS